MRDARCHYFSAPVLLVLDSVHYEGVDGLLEQQTGLNPTEIMTDTSGTSNMVFGLFWLLGYQFSPRLADAGEAIFWRVDKDADYGPLNDLARGRVNISKIEQHWDDMMRIAGSLLSIIFAITR